MSAPGDRAVSERALEEASHWCLLLSGGELTRSDQLQLQAWLSADPMHQSLLDDAMRVWGAVEEQATQPAMLELRSEALADLREVRSAVRARRSTLARVAWALAASVVLVIGIAIGIDQFGGDVYHTAKGERRIVTLTDGSIVSMDADSQVRVRYSHDVRALQLERGRAKFSVSHDPLRPFSVRAEEIIFVATGTQFSVERLGGDVRVIMYEGRVAVYDAPESPLGAPQPVKNPNLDGALMLEPGQEMIVDPTGAAPRLLSDEADKSLAWERGQLVFSHEVLSVAVERVNRYSQTQLRIGDAAAGNVRVSGVFATGDTRAFVEGVTELFPLEARTNNDEVILIKDSQR